MSNLWIKSHTSLSNRNRKVLSLAQSLRLKPVYLLGHLHSLWHVALEQQEDGDLACWNDDFIAQSSQFDGDAPQFVSLLHEHKWLDNRLIHDWLTYVGPYLVQKYHTSNPQKLVTIWAKHGLIYGRGSTSQLEGNEKEVKLHSRLDKIRLRLDKKKLTTRAREKKSSQKFTKPTAIEVEQYAKTIDFDIVGDKFINHYESNGWYVGKVRMKNWEAAVRTWKIKAKEFNPQESSRDKDAQKLYEERKKYGRCTTCGTMLLIKDLVKRCPKCEPVGDRENQKKLTDMLGGIGGGV